MGAVYEAEDPGTGAVVAVKVLATQFGDDPGLRRRFAAEIDTLKALRQPGIVRLLAFGEEDGQPYFAMELVRGRSLEDLLRGGRRFTWQETVAVAGEVAAALKAAHAQGVVHRDLKPANLLLVDDAAPGSGAVKLADFGIARLFGEGGQTQAGTVVGTVEYMAPEQAAGQPVDHRADLYALGLVMFAMLAGRPPFQGGQPLQVLDRQKRELPPRIASLVAGVPAELDELIARLLAKDPARRPASALALARLLAAVAAVHAEPPAAADPECDGPDTGPIDLLAATRPGTLASPRQADEATEKVGGADGSTTPLEVDPPAGPASLARQPTKPELSPERSPQPRANRHVTVAEEQRARDARASRGRRRELVVRGCGLVGIAALLVGTGWMILRRPGPDELLAAIDAARNANPERIDGLKDSEPLIENFLRWYPGDGRAASLRGLRREIDLDRLRKRADLRARSSRPPYLRIEHEYRQAIALKSADPAACRAGLAAILELPADDLGAAFIPDPEEDELLRDPDLWLDLVRQQIESLERLDAAERRLLGQGAVPRSP